MFKPTLIDDKGECTAFLSERVEQVIVAGDLMARWSILCSKRPFIETGDRVDFVIDDQTRQISIDSLIASKDVARQLRPDMARHLMNEAEKFGYTEADLKPFPNENHLPP